MLDVYPLLETAEVALLTEGVDRNTGQQHGGIVGLGRPPHGGRG